MQKPKAPTRALSEKAELYVGLAVHHISPKQSKCTALISRSGSPCPLQQQFEDGSSLDGEPKETSSSICKQRVAFGAPLRSSLPVMLT